MRVLVTGASGFVGRQAVTALARLGHDVITTSRREDLTLGGPGRHIPADLLAPSSSLDPLFSEPVDAILHAAWTVEHGKFWTTLDNLDWISATLRLARAAEQHGVVRFVGIGTCYEYQWPDVGECSEITTPIAPSTLYAVAKDATQRVLTEYFASHSISFAWARLFFLYGEHEGPNRLVSSIARRLIAGERAPASRGLVVRDFMDVRDAGDAIAALVAADVEGPVNIGSGCAESVASIARHLGAAAGRPDLIGLGDLPDRSGEPPRIVADVTRLRQEAGFVPRITLEQGLADALAFWRSGLDDRTC